MFGLFRKKKAYLIKWTRNCYVPNEKRETVVMAKCAADATSKFLQAHNVQLEDMDIDDIREVCFYE